MLRCVKKKTRLCLRSIIHDHGGLMSTHAQPTLIFSFFFFILITPAGTMSPKSLSLSLSFSILRLHCQLCYRSLSNFSSPTLKTQNERKHSDCSPSLTITPLHKAFLVSIKESTPGSCSGQGWVSGPCGLHDICPRKPGL